MGARRFLHVLLQQFLISLEGNKKKKEKKPPPIFEIKFHDLYSDDHVHKTS